MSVVYQRGRGGGRLEALQELLSHHAGKGGEVRWNLCLSWQPGTVTMAQIAKTARKLQKTAGEEAGRDWGNADHAVPSPGPNPWLQSQTAKVPACRQGHRWFAPRWMWV